MAQASPSLLELEQLLRIRWLTVPVQVGLLAIPWVSGDLSARLDLVMPAMALSVLTNLWAGRSTLDNSRTAMLLLLTDTLVLTLWLWATGGATNPFSLLYLVVVLAGSFALPPVMAWVLLGTTMVAFAGLFFGDVPSEHHGHHAMQSHLWGMFLAYALTTPPLVAAVVRTRISLGEARAHESTARALQSRTERLVALATLSAGAAHELASPLSTILLVAGELKSSSDDPAVLDDLDLIREEVLRCRTVLSDLAADAGAGMGESAAYVTPAALVSRAADGWDRWLNVAVENHCPEGMEVQLPVKLVINALRRLVGNARDASPTASPVTVRTTWENQGLRIDVQDQGQGMTEDTARRAIEPFFTTKATGEGTGLGLFFVATVVEHLEGSLRLDSRLGEGTRVTMWLPVDHRLPEEERST